MTRSRPPHGLSDREIAIAMFVVAALIAAVVIVLVVI